MRKILLPATALLVLSSMAHAQSSGVELYGIVDYGVNYQSNSAGGRLISGSSGIMQGTRWGFKGREYLGGGLSAVFQLENGFDSGTGKSLQGGLQFGRQAYVGLSDRHYGTLTMGRQYDALVTYVESLMTSAVYGGGTTAHPGDLDNLNNSKRMDNSIKYASPNMRGFEYGGAYGFGGQPGSMSRNQIWTVGARYDIGSVALAAAYLNVRNPNQSFFTSSPTVVNGLAVNNMTASPIYSGYASARMYQAFAAAADYRFGHNTVGLVYSHVEFDHLGDTTSGANPQDLTGSAKFDTGEINFSHHWTPALISGAVYSYTRGSGVDGIGTSHYSNFSLSLDYLLSKRTDVYVAGTTQFAGGTDSTGGPARATINALSASSTNRQTFVRIGMRHRF